MAGRLIISKPYHYTGEHARILLTFAVLSLLCVPTFTICKSNLPANVGVMFVYQLILDIEMLMWGIWGSTLLQNMKDSYLTSNIRKEKGVMLFEARWRVAGCWCPWKAGSGRGH